MGVREEGEGGEACLELEDFHFLVRFFFWGGGFVEVLVGGGMSKGIERVYFERKRGR